MILDRCLRVLYKSNLCSPAHAQDESHKTQVQLLWSAATTDGNMRFNTLFFLLITSCVCLALAQVAYDDCCLKYVRKMDVRIRRHAVNYRRQVPDGGCNIPAIIFKMKRGREICTDPRELWVVELMLKIDMKGSGLGRGRSSKRHPSRRTHKG